MKKSLIKKMVIATVSLLLLFIVVLSVHIYLVMRPKAPDAHTLVMARIDFKEDINQVDADKITTWLYQQKGIDHVLCNPKSNIAVFTFFPVKTNANKIINDFKTATNYKAERYMPSAEEMKSGCPISSNSFAYKAYSFVNHIF